MTNESLIIKRPLVGNYPITFRFGEAPDWYIKNVGYPHNGVDYGCPVGIEVVACKEGVVSFADDVPDADGKGINIIHPWGLSQYWHLSSLSVRQGENVAAGQKIGLSGNTGFCTGPHLHFGVKVKGDEPEGMRGWSNPLKYIETIVPTIPPRNITYKTHIVMPRETLWGIALSYYGKGYEWRKIYDANKDKIKNPNIIKPLQVLRIPIS